MRPVSALRRTVTLQTNPGHIEDKGGAGTGPPENVRHRS